MGFEWVLMGFNGIFHGDLMEIPSGELTVCELENHHAINGKIHYFNGHFQLLC